MTCLEVEMKMTHSSFKPSSKGDIRRKTDKKKAEVMDVGWMVGAPVSRLLIPRREISFPSLSLRLFHMRTPSPRRLPLHPRSKGRPSQKPCDILQPQIDGGKRKNVFSPTHYKDHLQSGLHSEPRRWLENQEKLGTEEEMGSGNRVR